MNYYLSCWYKRREFGIRAAIFVSDAIQFALVVDRGINDAQFSAAAVSGSFGGLLAAAISNMDGIGGKKGWAWIFVRRQTLLLYSRN